MNSEHGSMRERAVWVIESPPGRPCFRGVMMAAYISHFWANHERYHAELVHSAASAAVRYIPAPTWQDIEKIPAEWRDGRRVIVEDDEGDQRLVWWNRSAERWDDLDNVGISPMRYLDLVIPSPEPPQEGATP